ncbi:glycosyltransferase family 4 protein [Pedobacter frigiditerrae]|uniref:glycosyltransferase family 4 protein n=1 Tax=Pedobacter frigiditerrae TaxID=2530452 RepID=UPI00292E4182|nr:glycosyltransferase family 4 protein [Pedobacter frigiditerrae]
MKIAITAPSLDTTKNVSGVATVVNTIINHNTQQHYYHYLLGSPDKRLNKLTWAFELVRQILAFPFFLKRDKIDLVHQNLPFDPKGLTREFVINLWCRIMGVPVFLHVHGGVFLMEKTTNPIFLFFAQSVFKHSKKVVVLSGLEKETLAKLYHVDAEILCNSVDAASFKVLDRKFEFANPKILFLGRIHESKGIEDILEALTKLNKQANFTFVLCGTGPLKEELVPKFELVLGAKFQYEGIVSGAKKNDIIKSADFFLLPSRYGEGLPMALLESMAAGVVPVVTDDASMKFIVQEGLNGFRVKKNSPDDIYKQLLFACKNPEVCEQLSGASVKLIDEHYNIGYYVQTLNKLYSEITPSIIS